MIEGHALKRGVSGLARRLDRGALLAQGLLLVVLLSVAWGVVDAVPRGPDLPLLIPFTLLAVLLGGLLGRGRLPVWAVALLLATVGVGAILVRVGVLGGDIWRVVREVYRATAWPGGAGLALQPEALRPVVEAWQILTGNLATLLLRIEEWVTALVSRRSVFFDPVAATAGWALGIWLVSCWAGFALRRFHRPLEAIFPAATLLATLLSYTGRPPYVLLVVVGASLLLLALMSHRQRESQWTQMGVDFSRDIRADLGASAVLLALALVLVAALFPTITVQDVADFARRITERQTQQTELMADSLGVQQETEPGGPPSNFEQLGTTTLPQRHLIGSGPELSRQVALVIRTGELESMPDEMLPEPAPRYYWRSMVYSVYTGWGWFAGGTQINEYAAGQQANVSQRANYRRVRQAVQPVGDLSGLLYVAGSVVAVDQPYTLAWRPPDEIFAGTVQGETYRADSLVPVVSEDALRATDPVYPAWLLERYLQLPDGLPGRVIALARDLTATEPTPYDRALAIERYLRETYPYTVDVPAPPRDRDIADYFLFDLRKGYCDYYATAMVVLTRAAGLPARMVVGYAPGTYDAPNARYIITEADAHAWVEVYFPGYGWIEFEPTAGRDPIERATELTPPEWPQLEEPLAPLVPPVEREPFSIWPWLYRPALLAALALVLWALLDLVWLRLLPPGRVATVLYRRLWRHAARLSVPLAPGNTPYETTAALERRLEAVGGTWVFMLRTLEPAGDELRAIVAGYVQQWYTPTPLDAAARAEMLVHWSALRWRLWLAWLWRRRRNVRPFRRPAGLPRPPQPQGGRTLPRQITG